MTVTRFQNLPLADRERAWDAAAAERRVRTWADAEDAPTPEYRDAHVWYDAEAADTFGAYKLLVADVVGGRLIAIPRAVFAAAGVIDGARGGVDIPSDEVGRVRAHLARYYAKMGAKPPWR